MKFQSKNVVLFVTFVLIANLSSAQANLLNAKKVKDIGKKTEAQIDADNDKPLPYGYVDERDILWSVETWEIIDLNERVNFPLLFPIDTLDVSTYRRPLFDVIMKNVKNGKLDIYKDSHFAEKITLESINASLSKIDTLPQGYDQLNAGERRVSQEYITRRDLTAGDIAQYRVRGLWYFDKRQGELKYRILAIAPVAPDVNFINSQDAQASLFELFWIFYPQAREILHEAKTFNRKNDAKPISFDHLLNARMFSGVIYKEANVYGDRPIKEYLPGNSLFQLLESDKIKEKIRSREHDMWAN